MPKTLLAIDDSATMRKVLEITFAGEDFRVITADGSQRALAQMSEEPAAVVIDTSLGNEDAYALAKEVRSRDGRAAIVLMASRYNPYDVARGRSAGADDFIDKPFDTQALIEKVKKAIVARETSASAAPASAPVPMPVPPTAPAAFPAPAPSPQPAPAAAQAVIAPFGATPRPAAVAPVTRTVMTPQRSTTLSFEGGGHAASPPPPQAAPVAHAAPPHAAPPSGSVQARTVPSGIPVFQPGGPPPASAAPARPGAPAAIATPVVTAAIMAPTPASPMPGIGGAVNGQLASKLGALGLSPQQVEGVLALSREVVERVVWEVVPQLAETIIKEELARLTKD